MVFELPEELLRVAKDELNENEESREQLLCELRERLLKLPAEQRPHRMDDLYLLAYLRGTKWRIDIAEQKILNMAKFRIDHPEFSSDLRAAEFTEFYKEGPVRVLNGVDKQGRVVNCLMPAKVINVKESKWLFRWFLWCMNEQLSNPCMQVNGQIIVHNYAGFSISSMMGMRKVFTPAMMSKFFKMQQECIPFRMRGIFIVNAPPYMQFMWALMRPFMKQKLRDRMTFIRGSDIAVVHQFIAPEVLPPEFGGTLQEERTAWLDVRIARDRQQAQAALLEAKQALEQQACQQVECPGQAGADAEASEQGASQQVQDEAGAQQQGEDVSCVQAGGADDGDGDGEASSLAAGMQGLGVQEEAVVAAG